MVKFLSMHLESAMFLIITDKMGNVNQNMCSIVK